MKIFGWIVFAFGLAALVFGCSMDTTVSSGDSRVHNLGLLRAQENSIMVGGLALIIGILMVLFGGRSSKGSYSDHALGSRDAGREQATLRDSDGSPRLKRLPKLAEADKSLDNDAYRVYLVEKYEIKINEILKKYFVDGKLYNTVDLALARAHEMEMNVLGDLDVWTSQRAIEFLEKEGFWVRSVNGGFKVVANRETFDFANDGDLIAYAKMVNGE